MKFLALQILTFYQQILSPMIHQMFGTKNMCRYEQTCSAYMKEAIMTEGLVKGFGKGVKRLLSCQPFINYATY